MLSPMPPVPVMTGSVTLVMLSSLTPLSLAGASTRTPGVGATVSMVTARGVESAETLWAASVWVAVRLYAASARGSAGLTDQVPSPRTVVLPSTVEPLYSVMVSPTSPVPVTSGRFRSVISLPPELSLSGSRITEPGAAGMMLVLIVSVAVPPKPSVTATTKLSAAVWPAIAV